jgi:DNA-binding beta-propeller fold protein YncE
VVAADTAGAFRDHRTSAGREVPLFATDVSRCDLLGVDPASGAVTHLYDVFSPVPAGLAFDESTGMLYATDAASQCLVVIDPSTGIAYDVGPMELELPHGAAIDPRDGVLYVASSTVSPDGSTFLYAVDKHTAAPRYIGPLGYGYISALDFDPTSGILYGARAGPDGSGILLAIDTATGAGTPVGETHRLTALAFDCDGQLYGADNGLMSPYSALYIIDKTNGACSLVGSMEERNILGLVFGGGGTPVTASSWTSIKALFR